MKLPVNYETLSPSENRIAREIYIEEQKGLCYHCKEPLNGLPKKEVREKAIHKHLYPENFFKYPVHLHHNHNTGMTLGVVHNYCNAVLWEYHGE